MEIIFALPDIHNIISTSHNGSGKEKSQNKNSESEYGLHEMQFLGTNICFWTKAKKKINQTDPGIHH